MKRETMNSFFLGVITVLLMVIGFLTRNAYVETRSELQTMSQNVSELSERIVRLETLLTAEKKQ